MKDTTSKYFKDITTRRDRIKLLYQICENNIDYNEFKEVLKIDSRLGNTHFDVPGPDGKFGFGGKCFPKDTTWIKTLMENNDIDASLFETILRLNNEIRK